MPPIQFHSTIYEANTDMSKVTQDSLFKTNNYIFTQFFLCCHVVCTYGDTVQFPAPRRRLISQQGYSSLTQFRLKDGPSLARLRSRHLLLGRAPAGEPRHHLPLSRPLLHVVGLEPELVAAGFETVGSSIGWFSSTRGTSSRLGSVTASRILW